jgi:ankyrin repeat protein
LRHADDARLNECNAKTGKGAIHVICDDPCRYRSDGDNYYKQANKLRALLQRKASPDLATHEGLTAFLLAAAAGFAEAFDILLEYRADISVATESGMGVVAAATSAGSLRSLEKLHQLSAPVDWTKTFHLERTPRITYRKGELGPTGCSVVHVAATLSDSAVLKYLAAQDELSSKLDNPSDYGLTPLHMAAAANCEENVKFLLQNGANKDAVTTTRCSPLFLAASHGNHKVVAILLDSGASLTTDASGQRPEQAAKSCAHTEVVDLITTARSARAKQVDYASQLLEELKYSIERGDLEACKAYIERGALELGQFKCGCTPLIEAVRAGRADAVALLLEHDASTAGSACETLLAQGTSKAKRACGISRIVRRSSATLPEELSVAYLAIHDPRLNSLLGDLLTKCLHHSGHWAWSSPSLVHVAVHVNSAAIEIIAEHLNTHWEWYR